MSNIQQRLQKISPRSIIFVILFAAVMTFIIVRVFAASGTATLYVSSGGTQSVTNGQTFAVNIRVSSGSNVPVTGAAVYLSYPTNKLQVVGQSYGGPYNTQLAASDSGGVLRMDRAAFPAVSGGDQLFAQVTFKAIATGSAPLSFTGSSIVTSGEDDSNILSAKNGVTYNIVAPSAGGGSSSSGGTSSGGAAASGSKAQPARAGSSGGSVASSGGSGGTKAAGSSGSSSGSSSTSGGMATDSSASGNSSAAPGTPGSSGSSAAESAVAITIVDSDNKPVAGALVTINGQTVKTDKNGVARFTGMPAGDLHVAVSYNGNKTSKVVQVKGAAAEASPELFKVSIKRQKFNPAVLIVPVVILVAVGLYLIRPWGLKFAKAPMAGADPNSVISSAQPREAAPDVATIEKVVTPKHDSPGTVYAPGQSPTTPPAPDTTIRPEEPKITPPQPPKDGPPPS